MAGISAAGSCLKFMHHPSLANVQKTKLGKTKLEKIC